MKELLVSILLLISMVTVESTVSLNYDVIYVGGSGPGNYTSIQEAVNIAQDNSIIYIYPGLYEEDVFIDKPLSLIGLKIDDEKPIIIGSSDSTINITSNGCLLQNLVISNENNNSVTLYHSNKTIIEYIVFINSSTHLKMINSHSNTIRNNEFKNTVEGITLFSSNYNHIKDNNLFLSEDERIHGYGISLSSSNHNYLEDNNISTTIEYSNREFGIHLWNSSNNTIIDNEVNGSNFGIMIHSYSNYNNISYNNVHSNTGSGISIQGGSNNIVRGNLVHDDKQWSGISILKSWSKNNLIVDNNVYDNLIGIHLQGTMNTIKHNTIKNNLEYGVYLDSWLSNCKMNTLEENNLMDNELNAYFQVKPFSMNKWCDNYWSDWDSNLPKPIYGKLLVPITPFFGLTLPWITFDTQPVSSPNQG